MTDAKFGESKLLLKDNACGDNSMFFLQVPCLIDSSLKDARYLRGLIVGSLGVFIYLFTIIYIDYIKSVQTNKYIEWDVKTITAGDYTVEFDLKKSLYEHFLQRYMDKSNPISEIAQFKLYVKDELEERLDSMPNLGLDGTEGDDVPVKIAQITFAFDNYQVIQWLRARGTHIKNEDWARVDAVNLKINNAIKNDQELLDKLQRPCSVFATFESEEGYNRAL